MDKPLQVLVTGGKGQLGCALQAEAQAFNNINLVFTDYQELDITNKQALEAYLTEQQFDAVINCAAYTAVDLAEQEIDNAFALNHHAVKYLAELCKRLDLPLLHISTDYVFSGDDALPYTEKDTPSPKSVYGASKLAGEQALIASGVSGAVIRTSWLYSEFGANFVKTMLKLAKTRATLSVVCDQVGCPTYARDLAKVLLLLVSKQEPLFHKPAQVWHYCNSGMTSWYDFAKAIFELTNTECKVEPISTAQYPTLAKRPAYSVLATDKMRLALSVELADWRDSLQHCLSRLSS